MRGYLWPALFTMLLMAVAAISAAQSEDYRDSADLLIEYLVEERFHAVVSAFAPSLAEHHPVEELEEVWYRTLQRYGRYKSHRFGEVIEKDSSLSYLYVIKCASAVLAVVVAYDQRGQVIAFVLRPPEGEPIKAQPFWVVPAFVDIAKTIYQIPDYVDTSLFNEVEFLMQGAIPVPATMTVAKTDEPNPMVILFQGFGPTDRDETIGDIKPLRDIAWGLASRGIASIRFDCRSYTQTPEVIAGFNIDSYLLDDIAAMVAYTRLKSAIFDTTRIFIAGHGLGGMAAALAVQRDTGLAGVLLLSTPARPFNELLLETVRSDMATLASNSKAEKERLLDIAGILELLKNRRLPAEEMVLFAPARVWYDLMDNNHVEISRQLDLPVLIVHSGRDFEATDRDFDIWKELSTSNHNIRLKKYDDLNHFYQPGSARAGKLEYGTNTAPVDQRVIDDIAAWIKAE